MYSKTIFLPVTLTGTQAWTRPAPLKVSESSWLMSASTARAMLGLSYLQLDRDRVPLRTGLNKMGMLLKWSSPYQYHYQISTALWFLRYGPDKIFFQSQGHYGKVKGQIKVKIWRDITTLRNQCSYQIWTSYTLRFPRYGPDKIFQVQGHYGNVKG